MLEETTTIRSKAIFSDDKEHRLLLRKEWGRRETICNGHYDQPEYSGYGQL